MSELMGELRRTKMCGEFNAADIGKRAIVTGHAVKCRNLGNLIFIDVRDRSGVVQISLDDSADKKLFDKASAIHGEYVIMAAGIVRSRGANINSAMPTGEIEILADDIRILAEAETTPFVISDEAKVGESLRLKYRYLDLRRASLQNNLIIRDKISRLARNYLSDNGFLEIETPFLGKSTPEGARDYLVPSRVHNGEFYALPQSPQLFKQLLMIAGYDRYYQIARCFRDEDLRANRQPEFSQIDFEAAYVENPEEIMAIAEGMIKKIFSECANVKFDSEFRRIDYATAMNTYGSDKPDTRFGMHLTDLSGIVKDSAFGVFSGAVAAGGSVRGIAGKGTAGKLTRKQLTALGDFVKDYGAGGLCWSALKEDGVISSFEKNLSEIEIKNLHTALGAVTGDVIFIIADKSNKTVCESLGALRLHLAETFDLIDKSAHDFLWVTDFPLLEYDKDAGRYVAIHHPFTSPKSEDIPLLLTDPAAVRSDAYDLVIDGQEAGGGSIRIHTVEMQKKIFALLGMSEQDISERFGFFVDAFKYGAPPHGGLAFGLDRLVMLISGTDNIRDVIAFPKVQNASCLMTGAPSAVDGKQLDELAISIRNAEQNG